MGDNNIIYHLLFKTNLNLIKNFVTGNRADAILTRIVHAGPHTAAPASGGIAGKPHIMELQRPGA